MRREIEVALEKGDSLRFVLTVAYGPEYPLLWVGCQQERRCHARAAYDGRRPQLR